MFPRRQWERVAALPLDCISHPSFARQRSAPWRPPESERPRDGAASQRSSPLASYMERLYQVPLLTAEQEAAAFRSMNLLKYRAARLRARVDAEAPSRAELREIERLAAQAFEIRDHLIEANLRLVVSIAKKFVDPQTPLEELMSDGHLALMRAVEKFDFSRGFRFSTYATYAIRRKLYGVVTQSKRRRSRFVSPETLGSKTPVEPVAVEDDRWEQLALRQATLQRLVGRLDDRQRAIIRRRFGLETSQGPQTLRDLAAELGVCKERVRQLEARALHDLRTWAAELPSEWSAVRLGGPGE